MTQRMGPIPADQRRTFQSAGTELQQCRCSLCGMSASNVRHDTDARDREWAAGSDYYASMEDMHAFEHPDPAVMARVVNARETRWRINAERMLPEGAAAPVDGT